MAGRKVFIFFWAAALLAAGSARNLCARDAFVMLSGGDSPFDNNYSQYLQARAVANWFDRNYPRNSVWTFFGAGNVEGQKPVFGDVYRQVEREGLLIDSWLAGSLPHNLPARRDVILRVFREEILPAVADGGTLFLFVGDHGSRSEGRKAESVIDLWSVERDPAAEHGWRFDEDETLGVAELRRVLVKGLGKGRVVFCMTQCHAGGFHYLAIPHEITPNPKWFTLLPEWAAPKIQPAFPRAAGFTATDELSPAAGCDPDPNPENWAGYERFLPEKLFGLDLFTLKPNGACLRSFAEAHVPATLEDDTIDKPCSTSEQYLERWATLIETRLAKEPSLTWKIKRQVAAYQRAVDGAMPRLADPEFAERQEQFDRFIIRLAQQNPAARNLLLNGTRRELERAINPPSEESSAPPRKTPRRGRRGGGGFSDRRKLWIDVLRPAWRSAVDANQITNLPPAVLEFEKYLLMKEDRGRNYFFGGGDSMQEEVFWLSGYCDPQTLNPASAEAVARWGVERRAKILAWAKASEDEEARDAAEKLSQTTRQRHIDPAPVANAMMPAISREIAAERTLFYRRVLAAWAFLIAANERPALARVRELTELERAPLPPLRSMAEVSTPQK
jgi:hypothetical protein